MITRVIKNMSIIDYLGSYQKTVTYRTNKVDKVQTNTLNLFNLKKKLKIYSSKIEENEITVFIRFAD